MENISEITQDKEAARLIVTQFELTKALYTSELFAKVELTCSAKLFLWALCTHYNPKNKTMFPSQATVSKKLGISEKSAERAVKELKNNGLVEYETKKVNHYRFSAKFFELVKMSGDVRQNVGSAGRQNVGQTNKPEQKKKNYSFDFKNFNAYGKYLQPGGRAIPSIEETKKLIEEREKVRAEGFSPLEYSYEEAHQWIKSMPAFWLKKSKIARFLVEKYKFEDFLYTLEFPIEDFQQN